MKTQRIGFSEKALLLGDKAVILDYPISDAFALEGRIIVLYDPASYPNKTFGQFPNLIALNSNVEKLWTAELPTTQTGDSYYRISSRDPLIACSLSSFECQVDPATGKIKIKTFLK